MKKISNFIVDHHKLVLSLFILITIICFGLSKHVSINRDITKYLPKTSEVRIGMDIMEEEFETNSSSFNLMFKDLTTDEKNKINKELENLKHVDEVKTQEKDNYVLYELTTDVSKDSKEAKKLYNDLTTKYEDYNLFTSGDISEEYKEVLPKWIVALAIGCALVILIIMSESYIEPFLFLIAILMAVVLNKGTNIIFPQISSITDSITAILQLALSMDYSIMLINRYRQEKENEPDNVKAMKKALYHSFKSISSSSLTTIVGLLALVFMSFTIGLDMGLVLAKGVLFSLLAVFTTLPALILIFDKLITKTKKKTIPLKMDFLGKFAYKLRYVGIFIFIFVLVTSFILKGNVNILYTDKESDDIAKVFTQNNQMAIIYDNKDEDKISKLCANLETNHKIADVLCYSNTLNLPLKYQELNPKLADFGQEENIEDYLLKIVYYNYYNPTNNVKMTFNQFVNFIENDVYSIPDLNKHIDQETKNNITRLKYFVNRNEVQQLRDPIFLANVLDIDANDVNNLLIYYNSLHENTELSLPEFTSFINNYLKNSEYQNSLTKEQFTTINKMQTLLDKNTLTQKLTRKQMANYLNIDNAKMQNIYLYYLSNNLTNYSLSLEEFANFLMTTPYYQNLDEVSKEQIELISKFSNKEIINNPLPLTSISQLLNIDVNLLQQLTPNNEETLINIINILTTNENIKSTLTIEQLQNLETLKMIINSSLNNQAYSYQDLSALLNLEEEQTKGIYSLYYAEDLTISPIELLNFLTAHQNDELLRGQIPSEVLTLKTLANNTLNNTKYSASSIANILNTNQEDMQLLYSLYDLKYLNQEVDISLNDFLTFISNDVLPNPKYNTSFTTDKIAKINTAQTLINGSLNNQVYQEKEMLNLLDNLTDNLDHNLIDVLYIYYGSIKDYHEDYTLTVEKFVNYLNNDILNDQRFNDFIDEKMQQRITDAKEDIKEAKDLLVAKNHSRVVLNTNYDMENKETLTFIKDLKNTLPKSSYIIGNSAMAQDLSESFASELNLITILTIAFIFVVVLITFKSVLIPLILVLLIQTAVYTTMGILSFEGGSVYFIALLIVQSILMGATIDYAILFTSYYLEHRKSEDVKQSLISAYNNSIHTILTSASILILVTLIVGHFSTSITSKICTTISQGTICSSLLILILLPMLLATFDKLITHKIKRS